MKKSPGNGRGWNAGAGGGGGGADDVPPPHPHSIITSSKVVNQGNNRETLPRLTPTGAVFIGISNLRMQLYITSLTLKGEGKGSSGRRSSIGGWVHRLELDEDGKGSQPFLME